MRAAVVAHSPSRTNVALAAFGWNGVPSELVSPREALLTLGPGDLALARLDVRADLDGVEEGLWSLERLVEGGVTVLNQPAGLLCAHDKLLTARMLRRTGLPHPRTMLIERSTSAPDLDFPAVLKPRFGSWGRDVLLCRDRGELERSLETLSFRPWFRRTGVLVQELITPLGYDIRLIVSGGRVVGAAQRIAAPGEWRTNVALGATVVGMVPPPAAWKLALEAAAASGLDLVGVDLLPVGSKDFCVIELNGAVDFRPVYSFSGRNVYRDTMSALAGSHLPVPATGLGAVAAVQQ
ncbi:MAG: RimK family alpha-L-glutamate ligase [Gaiellaceae bacterium]